MTTAQLIVRTLDLAANGIYQNEEEINSPQAEYANEIRRRYEEYKLKHDFTESAWKARTEVVQIIIEEHQL